MEKIHVQTTRPYDIFIGHGLLEKSGKYIQRVSSAKTVCIVSDSNIAPIYLDVVEKSLSDFGFTTNSFTFPAGETSKTLTTVAQMLSFFAQSRLTRSDLVVALGGGVCGDMAGFAAATYMRGIDYIQIPTSLLSQIDSSVGGKTGVDLPEGKNLAGAFHQPILVLIDIDALKTLPNKFFLDGMGEAIKYGCIFDKDLFYKLQTEKIEPFLDEMVYRNVDIKRQIVERDEHESGERMLLNFGHTIGHAIENYYNYDVYTHGQAVAIGMIMMTNASEKAGLTKKGTTEQIIKQVEKFELPTSASVPIDDLLYIMQSDKKSRGDRISLVILEEIGKSKIYPVSFDDLSALLKAGATNG